MQDYAQIMQQNALYHKHLSTKLDAQDALSKAILLAIGVVAILLVLVLMLLVKHPYEQCDIVGHTYGCWVDNKFYPVHSKQQADKLLGIQNHE